MQIRHSAAVLFGADGVTVWDAKRFRAHRSNPLHLTLREVVDTMGQGSRQAQGLSQPLTTMSRLESCPDHRLYILATGQTVVGILKVGVKRLFVRDVAAQLHEIDPLCVLDFYVHEAAQRSGHGKQLFESMLVMERKHPHQLGYDRPSHKFKSFLNRYYDLSSYVEQHNNFVVFDAYFNPKYEPITRKITDRSIPAPVASTTNPYTPTQGLSTPVHKKSDLNHSIPFVSPVPMSPTPQPRSGPAPHPLNYDQTPVQSYKLGSSLRYDSSQSQRREASPTRSGVSYNIITLQDEPFTATSPPNFVRQPVGVTSTHMRGHRGATFAS